MNLGLYINVLLTAEAALKSTALKPIYQRRYRPLDARRKADVLKLSISSMQGLPITKMIVNLEAQEEFAHCVEEIYRHIQACFPQAELVREAKRPTTLAAHKASVAFASSFFGETMPVICVYNHDHIFVDYRTAPFVELIEECFSKRNQQEWFLAYSHAPENISAVHDIVSHHARNVCFFGGRPAPQPPQRVGQRCWVQPMTAGMPVDSIFVTTTKGLHRLWHAMLPFGGYLPRADWAGAKTGPTQLMVLLSPREFFRHFDGYGHVTALCGAYALGLDGFGPGVPRTKCQLPAVYGGDAADMSSTVDEVAEGYAGMFFELNAVAARDVTYAGIVRNVHRISGLKVMEKLFELFSLAYLDAPGELDRYSDEQKRDLRLLVLHKVFARAAAYQADLLADCQFYGAWAMQQALAEPRRTA